MLSFTSQRQRKLIVSQTKTNSEFKSRTIRKGKVTKNEQHKLVVSEIKF